MIRSAGAFLDVQAVMAMTIAIGSTKAKYFFMAVVLKSQCDEIREKLKVQNGSTESGREKRISTLDYLRNGIT